MFELIILTEVLQYRRWLYKNEYRYIIFLLYYLLLLCQVDLHRSIIVKYISAVCYYLNRDNSLYHNKQKFAYFNTKWETAIRKISNFVFSKTFSRRVLLSQNTHTKIRWMSYFSINSEKCLESMWYNFIIRFQKIIMDMYSHGVS